MRLLLLIKGLGIGGAEQHVVQIASAMKLRGHDVKVSYLLPHKTELVRSLQAAGIPVSCWGGLFRPWWFSSIVQAWRELRGFKPEVVHVHLPIPALFVRFLKPLFRFKLIYTEHNVFSRLRSATRLAHRFTWGIDDIAISCSKAVADSLPRKSFIVDNGINAALSSASNQSLRVTLGLPAQSKIWLCVANFRKQKNHALLIKVFDRMVSDQGFSDWHLALIGQDATERSSCESLANSLPARAQIHFAGKRSEAASWMSEADAFVLASNEEGLPLALLEAMRAGLPAVVTDAGGMPSVVTPATGVVVPRGDEDALLRAMKSLSGAPQLRQQMGAAARARFHERYTEDAMLNSLENMYISALNTVSMSGHRS
jgi:L-malate glycosyltransferase